MLEVVGNFVFTFEIVGQKFDVLRVKDLIEFIYERNAGGSLPKFQLIFSIHDLKYLQYFNEANSYKVTYGKNKKETKVLTLRQLGHPFIQKSGSGSFVISISGFLDIPDYYGTVSYISPKSSGLAVLQNRAKSLGLRLNKDNIKESQDSQSWVQFQESHKRFFDRLVLHSWLDGGKSFPVYAVTGSTELRVYSYTDILKKTPKFRFVTKVSKSGDIPYVGDPFIIADDKSDVLNMLIGHNSALPVRDLVTGQISLLKDNIKPLNILAKEFVRSSKELERTDEIVMYSDSMHANYYKAEKNNFKRSALFSYLRLGLYTNGLYIDIEPLDFVYYEAVDTNAQSVDNLRTGSYVITKIVDSIKNLQFYQYMEISREGLNYSKGAK